MFVRFATATALPILLFGWALSNPPANPDSVKDSYEELRLQIGDKVGWRHLLLANKLEDMKVYPLAMKQFRLAAARAAGPKKALAEKAVKVMTEIPKDRIENYYHWPTKGERIMYRQKAAVEHRRDREGWKRLADFAGNHPDALLKEALDGYTRLIQDSGDPLKVDEKGRILLDEGPIPEFISTKLCQSQGTLIINGDTYLRNGFTSSIPAVRTLYNTESENIRVFYQEHPEIAGDLHDLVKELHRCMKKDFGDCPDRPVTLFVFTDRDLYEDCCFASKLSPNKASLSFTRRNDLLSVLYIDEESGKNGSNQDLHSLAIREFVRLFHYGITQLVMPDWYIEGLAHSYAGPGAFKWNRGRLTVKGELDRLAIAPLLESCGMLSLEDLLFTVQTKGSSERTLSFYAQSCAFLKYLKAGAGTKISRKFKNWEEECFSKALDENEALELFHNEFISDLSGLEHKFHAYLKRLFF